MKRKPMGLKSAPAEEPRPTVVLEYTSMVIGTREQIGAAHQAFEELANEFYERCEKLGVHLQGSRGVVRPLTREEAIELIPRKFHLELADGAHLCDTAYVARAQLVKDVGRVTCKLCLRKLKEQNDRLEAERGQSS